MPFSASEIERARRETPGCANVTHFNNAGAALMPQPVIAAQLAHIQLEASIGGYEAATQRSEQIERVYQALARMLNCGAHELALIENATRAWDMAFYSFQFQSGDRILTANAEYVSNYLAFIQVARRTGAQIEVIPDDDYGQVSVDALKNMVDERVKLIAITHVPTNGGLVNPAAEVGAIARAAGIPFLLDACQSVGQMAIDVEAIGCDLLSATGRKFLRGPRGTGFLYVRQTLIEKLEPPFIDLQAADWIALNSYSIRPDARRFENWETNYAARLGLGAAVEYALGWGLDKIQERVFMLAAELRACLATVPGVTLHDLGQTQSGIVTFTVAGKTPQYIQEALAQHNINVSVSLTAYARLDMDRRGLESLVRASVHYYLTEQDITQFCNVMSEIITTS